MDRCWQYSVGRSQREYYALCRGQPSIADRFEENISFCLDFSTATIERPLRSSSEDENEVSSIAVSLEIPITRKESIYHVFINSLDIHVC
jgi:hypothetical protein